MIFHIENTRAEWIIQKIVSTSESNKFSQLPRRVDGELGDDWTSVTSDSAAIIQWSRETFKNNAVPTEKKKLSQGAR